MNMAKQLHEIIGNAEEAAHTAASTPVAKVAREVTDQVERVVARRPTNELWRAGLLGASATAMAASLIFAISNRKHEALYVGQWVSTLLLAALWAQTIKR